MAGAGREPLSLGALGECTPCPAGRCGTSQRCSSVLWPQLLWHIACHTRSSCTARFRRLLESRQLCISAMLRFCMTRAMQSGERLGRESPPGYAFNKQSSAMSDTNNRTFWGRELEAPVAALGIQIVKRQEDADLIRGQPMISQSNNPVLFPRLGAYFNGAPDLPGGRPLSNACHGHDGRSPTQHGAAGHTNLLQGCEKPPAWVETGSTAVYGSLPPEEGVDG